MKKIVLLVLWMTVASSFATTYYIDFDLGLDSRNGTSMATAWKRCPGMATFAGTYTPGTDRFVFKGNVTWTGVYPWSLSYSNCTYETDPTWFTGASWGRAVFDGQFNPSVQGLVAVAGNNITFGNGFDCKNVTVQQYYGAPAIINSNGPYTNNRITGALIRDWNHIGGTNLTQTVNYPLTNGTINVLSTRNFPSSGTITVTDNSGGPFNTQLRRVTYTGVTSTSFTGVNGGTGRGDIGYGVCLPADGFGVANAGGVALYGPSGTPVTMKVDHCEFTQSSGGQISGCPVINVGDVSFCQIHDFGATAFQSSGVFHDNVIWNQYHPAFPSDHLNIFSYYGSLTAYNNIIHDIPGESGITNDNIANDNVPNRRITFYNNVCWNVASQVPFRPTGNSFTGNQIVTLANNTIVCGSVPFAWYTGAYGNLGTLILQNNHFICGTSPTYYQNPSGGTVQSKTDDHNLVETGSTATSEGYNIANQFAPANSSAPTIDTGTALASILTTDINGIVRPHGSSWDRGAYEWTGIPPSPTPTPSATPTPTPTPTPSPTATITPTTLPLANRDFETSPYSVRGTIPGWTIAGPGHIMAQNEGYTSASHAATFNEGGDFNGDTLAQSFFATVGQTYTLTFKSGIFGTHSGSALRLNVTVTGTIQNLNQTVTPVEAGTFTPASVTFQPYSFTFVADNAIETLKFTDLDLGNATADIVLDDVDVTSVGTAPFLIQFYP